MADNPKFGSGAQTVQQRTNILKQMEAVCPGLVTKASAYTKGLYGRYVAGELSWGEVRSLRGLNFTSRATERLRRQGSAVHMFTVFSFL